MIGRVTMSLSPRPDSAVSGRDESESVPALVGAILRATAPLESESAAR